MRVVASRKAGRYRGTEPRERRTGRSSQAGESLVVFGRGPLGKGGEGILGEIAVLLDHHARVGATIAKPVPWLQLQEGANFARDHGLGLGRKLGHDLGQDKLSSC